MGWFDFLKPRQSQLDAVMKNQIAVGMRQMLGGALAGSWATDHREEVNHYTGFNHVVISAIADQCAAADVKIYIDKDNESGSRRKALKSRFKSIERYKAVYGTKDSDVQEVPGYHPLFQLMKTPNPHESGGMFRFKQALQLRLTGSCLVWNVPSIAGTTCQRYVLPTAMTTPVMKTLEMPLGGWRVSGYSSRYIPLDDQGFTEGSPTWVNLLGKIIDARQVQVIRYPHAWWFDDGQSPISAGAEWVDTEQGVNRCRAAQLRNGVDGSILYTLPPDAAPDQDEVDRIQMKLTKRYGGVDNVGKVIVAQSGTTVTQLSTDAREMCFTEAWDDVKSAILALHHTPPVAIGIQEPGAYAAYYASMLAWRLGAIQPLCNMLAESDSMHLAPEFGDHLTVEIDAPIMDDKDQDEKEFTNNVNAGICTYDELRAIRNLPPLPNGEGNRLCGGRAIPESAKESAKLDGNADKPNDDAEGEYIPKNPFESESKALKAAVEAAKITDAEWEMSQAKYRQGQTIDSFGRFAMVGLDHVTIEKLAKRAISGKYSDQQILRVATEYGYKVGDLKRVIDRIKKEKQAARQSGAKA